MNRKKLYEKTVNLLLDAYNEGKLSHGSCSACAVGNICGGNDLWSYLFVTNTTTQYKEKPGIVRVKSAKTGIIEIKEEELQHYVDQGFVYYHYYDFWLSYISPLLQNPDSDLAIFSGNQFLDLWKGFITGEK